jgi:hypothetical protein
MPIVEAEDGWAFKSSDAVLPPNEEQIEHECDIEAFSKK